MKESKSRSDGPSSSVGEGSQEPHESRTWNLGVAEKRARIILLVEIVVAALGTLALGSLAAVFGVLVYTDETMKSSLVIETENFTLTFRQLIPYLGFALILSFVGLSIEIGLTMALRRGVIKRKTGFLTLWFVVRLIFFTFSALSFLAQVVTLFHGAQYGLAGITMVFYLPPLIYRGLSIKIIGDFKAELQFSIQNVVV